jgi:glucose-1,6-bisphosphate synthase
VEELRLRLCCRMAFGTAGLRAAMGVGFALIKDMTIIQSKQVNNSFLL